MNIRNIFIPFLLLSTVAGSAVGALGGTTALPTEIFFIGDFQLGKTTLPEVQTKLGNVRPRTRDNGLVRTICYFSKTRSGFVVLKMDAGVLGGLQTLTGFNIQFTHQQTDWCSMSLLDLGSLKIGGGIKLGESENEFKAHFPVRLQKRKTLLNYQGLHKREMTNDELASMRLQWPDLPNPSFFDVVESVQGKFSNGALNSYRVWRTESY